jgi:putative spermidine/putrescine transport system substrate-binding protein
MFVSRRFIRLAVLGALLVSVLGFGAVQAQEPTTLNIYVDADTNITDWLSNLVAPAFEAENPQYKLNIVIARGGITMDDVITRTIAALETNSDPQVDVIEGLDPSDFTAESMDAELWVNFSAENIPNYDTLNPSINIIPQGLPYRGSQVLLAYDSSVIPEEEVPQTFADLVEWVKAHPGQFVYCRPDRGGSGGNFVTRAIYEANGQDPSIFTTDNYSEELANQLLPPAWELLADINSSIYQNGSYPAGNLPTLQLLANGSVSMISAWSDQALQAIQNGTLPDTIKVTQFTDLPMSGGYVYTAVPKNATNMEGALAFANYYVSLKNQESVIRDIGGFPTINSDLLPEELRTLLATALSDQAPPVWPGGGWNDARNNGWYRNVATTMPATETPVPTVEPTATPAS